MADAAAAEVPEERELLPEFIHEILYPAALNSFRDTMPSGQLEVLVHRAGTEGPTSIRIGNMFPFMTLKDVKIAIYLEMKRDPAFVPEYVYLCIDRSGVGAKPFVGGQTAPVDFMWNFPTVSEKTPFRLPNPVKLASGQAPLDNHFVDSGGDRRIVSLVNRERLTIEDAFFKRGVAKGVPVLHAYTYANLLSMIPGVKPPSEKEWNGRLYPMFPSLTSASVEPTAEQLSATARLVTIFSRRQQFLIRLESILSRDEPLVALSVAGIKSLVLRWEQKKNIQGIETQFYDANVSEHRPFMRLIPTEGYGISKVFLKNGNVPDIDDPKLLVQWSQERSPTPDQDYVFAKLLIRRGLMNVPPIYATLRLLNDGTADCILQPPKGMKKLEPRGDLESVGEHILQGLQELPYLKELPSIYQGNIVLGIRVKKGGDAIITPRILRERLPIFSSMFQEIPALPGENPMVMLRFKLVSNFVREDRIQTFITQVIHRKAARSENIMENLVGIVADEFQIDEGEARKQVAIKLRNQGEVTVVVPETREYMRQNNPGIDIAIFAQHPFYTFHVYDVDSLENFRRIVTALSILMSVDSDSLQVDIKGVKELVAAEASGAPKAEESEDESEGEKGDVAEPGAGTPEAAELDTDDGDGAGGEELDYLDFFSSQPLEEGEYAEEARRESEKASALVGESSGDAPSGERKTPVGTPVEEVSLKETLEKAKVSPKEELRDVKEVVVPKPIKVDASPAVDDENAAASSTKGDGIANFFLNKLQEADSRLFEYTKSNPSLKRYVSMCQPTYGRQPAVVSEDKFQEIQEEYADDNVFFQIYPLQPGEPVAKRGDPETDYYTVLKYGSSPHRLNYYLCCRYFCTRDEMLVREVDLQGTKMRRPTRRANGTMDDTKKPGECPFCRGRIIRSRRAAQPGETILERGIKPPTQDKRHIFIGFTRKTPHPEGFQLPCCFTEDVPLFLNNRVFDKFREWGIGQKPNVRPVTGRVEAELEEGEEGEEEEEEGISKHTAEARAILDYYTSLSQIHKKYIVGAEKMPLDIGAIGTSTRGEAQIGLLPTVLDEYFDQEPTQLVSRAFNPQKIVPGGMGFLRIAVENRYRYQADSFLAAVAPFYSKNTAEQMKALIRDSIMPREFLALNYGNLAIEFYNPSNTTIQVPSAEALRQWASKFLNVDVQEENSEAVLRAYLSYYSFEEWLISEKTKKEYRQFALLFAQSSILRQSSTNGITFIVLDILKSGKMNVRCPPYGFNAEYMAKNDVAFLLHHWSGIWEPVFFVDNRAPVERFEIFSLVFQYAAREHWPPIVKQRLDEFKTQCSSSGRSVYTSQGKMNPMAMIPASLASRVLNKEVGIVFDGVIRDAYNHIGALVYRGRKDENNRALILPVIDDGELYIGNNLYMDWDDPALHPAPIDKVVLFYKKYIETNFEYYPGFSATTVIKLKRSGDIEAIQLRNLLYVPVGPPSNEKMADAFSKSNTRTIDELEWSKNHDICMGGDDVELPGDSERMEITEFQEIFEHLRLTFANWLALNEGGGEFRKGLEEIIFSRRLPLYEKRKRLEIRLSPKVTSWITTDFHDEDSEAAKEVSLLRVDCRVRSQDKCVGRCVWKTDGAEGTCLLHVPEETALGEDDKKVVASRVLLLRLIEELLRYGERRKQLLENNVNRLVNIEKPVVIPVEGTSSKQVIFPEKSAAWFELLRLEWASKPDEEPRFLEEMSGRRTMGALAPQQESTTLPERLQTILNGEGGVTDPKTGALRLYRLPLASLIMSLNLVGSDIGLVKGAQSFTDVMLRSIVQKTGGSVIQIDLRKDPSDKNMITGARPIKPLYEGMPIPVFIITETGPALLVLDPSIPEILQRQDMPGGLITVINTTLAAKKGVVHIKMKEGAKKLTLGELRKQVALTPSEAEVEGAVIEPEVKRETLADLRRKRLDATTTPSLAVEEEVEAETPVAFVEAPAPAAPEVLTPPEAAAAPEILAPAPAPEVLAPAPPPEVLAPPEAAAPLVRETIGNIRRRKSTTTTTTTPETTTPKEPEVPLVRETVGNLKRKKNRGTASQKAPRSKSVPTAANLALMERESAYLQEGIAKRRAERAAESSVEPIIPTLVAPPLPAVAPSLPAVAPSLPAVAPSLPAVAPSLPAVAPQKLFRESIANLRKKRQATTTTSKRVPVTTGDETNAIIEEYYRERGEPVPEEYKGIGARNDAIRNAEMARIMSARRAYDEKRLHTEPV